ncbi:MAG: ELM1/GtrOC1 family putative glycosyltransferase [Desulfatiglans sp.]|jgi:mitochondrial fission protein ELM1|nr:ELM1/GtrOC1 family putative glycosyltransferase [Desulfatiglans sp.]
MDKTYPLSITAFLDGRPGHEKQTNGILQALEKMTPIQVEYRRVHIQGLGSDLRDWLSYAGHFWLGLRWRPRRFSGTNRADMIIGTGSHVHISMLLTKGDSNSKVVTCMTPNPLLIRKMDLCFVPQHDNQRPADNIFITIGPPNTSPFLGRHDRKAGLILIGGIDEKSHAWNSQKTLSHIDTILNRWAAIRWTIASSPRTPQETSKELHDMAIERSNVTFVEPEETGPGWIEEQYGRNHFVWVTADSISMIYEALTAGCRVGILPVDWKKKKSKYVKAVDYVLSRGMSFSYDQWMNNKIDMDHFDRLDEAGRCAKEILKRWWPERLP